VTAALTAQLATSGLQERNKILVAVAFSIVVTLIIYPFVVGWTLGLGFMYKLGLVDKSGCCSIHLVAGFCSLFSAAIIKSRVGRYDPIIMRRVGQLKTKEIILSHT
jgi:ammonia channel protein AmtB